MLVFLQVSMFHQTMAYFTRVNLRLLWVVGIPAMVGVVLAGGIQSTFRGRPAYYWAGFIAWMALAVPFSSWKGASTLLLLGYLRAHMIMLFVIGGLALTWRECKVMMWAIALGAAVAVLSGRVFMREGSGGYRTGMEFGTVNNPNDFAGHLLFALPFLVWVVLASRATVLRIAALLGVGYCLYEILGSASRGALLGLIGAVLYFLWRGTTRQRIALLAMAPLVATALVVAVPRQALQRITTFSASAGGPQEAIDSTSSRRYLLQTSISYAVHHPLLGVGPGEFGNYEGSHSRVIGGRRGEYAPSHDSYTAVASECGIPAFLCYMAAIFSTFRLLSGVFREAGNRPEFRDIRMVAFSIQMSMVGFCIAICFLNFAYFFYLPALSGLAIAVGAAAKQEFQSRGNAAVELGNIGNSAGLAGTLPLGSGRRRPPQPLTP
jgi:hypothetical protein